MMLQSLHNQTQTTNILRLSGFLRSLETFCIALSSGIERHFIVREQGRKPSGIIWVDSLFGMRNGSYAPATNNNDDAKPADDETRRRCRSYCDKVHT